ncbi:ATP-binding cassette domain-containing protein [Williamsoniiplasma luminosum]|uniref:ABC transporter domain-containing protein n=1 Tax=Williamsoniiplasma luminosum TaxID=214888 RepID=A0A2S0NJ33_9MOLU|nr:ATP-binding cassette domain-containing protein [Williamsoniiplasma luminosum]AVP49025.1 MAG: hypothetical protein C5T88_00270 [Williamsoniiplasma luminosum]
MEKTIDQTKKENSNVLVVVHNLTKIFSHTVWTIKKVSFEINRGEAIAFVGNNGTGKSVLGKLIGNVIQQTSGIIDYFFNESNIFKAIGYQSREQAWPVGFKVKDVIALYKTIYEVKDKTWIAKLIDTFGFEEIMEKKLSSLDILSLQLFAIFLVLLYKPELIVIDEFSSSIDFERKMKILNLLKEYRNNGGTIIIVQPEDFILNALCNRIITLNKGEMQDDSSLKNIVKEHGSTFEYIRKLAEEAKENKRRIATNHSFEILLKKFRTAFANLENVYEKNCGLNEDDHLLIQIKNTFYQIKISEDQLTQTFTQILLQKNVNQAIKNLKRTLKELRETIIFIKKHRRTEYKDPKFKKIELELEKMANFIENKILLILKNDELFKNEETEEDISSAEKKQLKILKKRYIKEELKIIKLERKRAKKNQLLLDDLENFDYALNQNKQFEIPENHTIKNVGPTLKHVPEEGDD